MEKKNISKKKKKTYVSGDSPFITEVISNPLLLTGCSAVRPCSASKQMDTNPMRNYPLSDQGKVKSQVRQRISIHINILDELKPYIYIHIYNIYIYIYNI